MVLGILANEDDDSLISYGARSAPQVRQLMAAICMLGDYLQRREIIALPANSPTTIGR